MEHDKQHVLEIFPKEQYTSMINTKPLNKITFCKIKDKNKGKNMSANLCVFFSIDYENTPIIKVILLNKCHGNSGSTLLRKLEQLAKRMGITTIILEDESNIEFNDNTIKISLRILYLLTTGETWYNFNGYYGENDDFVRNKELIRMSVRDFLNLCSEQNEVEVNLDRIYNALRMIDEGLGLSVLDDVKKYFTRIKTLLKSMEDDDVLLQPIHDVIDFIDKSNIFKGSDIYTKHVKISKRISERSSSGSSNSDRNISRGRGLSSHNKSRRGTSLKSSRKTKNNVTRKSI